ncbi:MAG: exo-alpha-sialidase [Kiritimatiellaeota bacterium]|nr:exo-alpha-sialidase [Kiritimatiellota bacterium]
MNAVSPAWLAHRSLIYPVDADRPTPECHASTLIETTPGRLAAAWFGGAHEKAADVGIWVSRFEDNRWTQPVEVADGTQYSDASGRVVREPCWNPVLARFDDDVVYLFFKVGPDPRHWWGEFMISRDGGMSWTGRRRLPEGILGPIKNKPVRLSDQVLLCPSSTESAERGWDVHFELFGGLSEAWWRRTPDVPRNEIQAIQPTVLLHPGNRLQALCRTRRCGRIAETWSEDGGLSWSPLRRSQLPHPGSGIDAVTLRDGRHLLVYNHSTEARTPLNLAISADGRRWQQAGVLEDAAGEFSYPAVIQSSDGLVHITYTWKRIGVRHVVVDPMQLSLP